MPTSIPTRSRVRATTSTQVVLREAKRLHRAVRSDSLSTALPVLRRLLAAGAIPAPSLPELFRRRREVQRKHLLRTLAVEMGHSSWEEYRPKLDNTDIRDLEPFEILDRGCANLNLWFSSETEALQYATDSGGRVVRVGIQAVVLPAAGRECLDERGM